MVVTYKIIPPFGFDIKKENFEGISVGWINSSKSAKKVASFNITLGFSRIYTTRFYILKRILRKRYSSPEKLVSYLTIKFNPVVLVLRENMKLVDIHNKCFCLLENLMPVLLLYWRFYIRKTVWNAFGKNKGKKKFSVQWMPRFTLLFFGCYTLLRVGSTKQIGHHQ